jgi:hypothetical protein
VNFWKVILATVVIFATGVVTGGLLVNFVEHSHPRGSWRREAAASATNSANFVSPTNSQSPPRVADLPKPRLPEILNKQFVQQLDDLLHLTTGQRDAIQKIITDAQGQIRKTTQDARQQIRQQLTPDQRKQFEDLMKRPQRKPSSTNAPAVLPPPATTNAPGV